MAYPDFSHRDLIKKFDIKFKTSYLFTNIPSVPASDWLTESLRRAITVGFKSEKARSELLVAPVLVEFLELTNHALTLYSGENLNADETKGLNGECDFMLSFSQSQEFVTAPIFCITAAKKQDIEKGLVQCAAQLIGAKIFNQKYEGKALPTLYGCSTTGVEWRFIQLKDNVLTVDRNRFLINQPEKILGGFVLVGGGVERIVEA